MAVTKAKKAEQIEKLNSQLQKASSMIVGSFSKLTVAKDYELRKTVRSAGGRYQVVKNTLAKRASEGTKVSEALKGLKGVSSIAYTPCHQPSGNQGSGHYAFEGRALLQAPLPDECSGTAPGNRDERSRPRSCGGSEPGRGKEKVQGRRRSCQQLSLSSDLKADSVRSVCGRVYRCHSLTWRLSGRIGTR